MGRSVVCPWVKGDSFKELLGRSLRIQWRVNGRVIGVSVVVNNGKWGVDGEGSTNKSVRRGVNSH